MNPDRYSLLEIAARSGFQIEQTGGGTEALMRTFDDGDYCVISSGGEIPQDSGMFETCEVGFYSSSGEQQFAFFAPTFLDALARVAVVRPALDRGCG